MGTYMLTTYATLDTSEAHRLIKRLCAHWSHKLTVEAEDGLGRIDFGESRCLLTADTERLHIKLDCPDEAASGRMQQVVVRLEEIQIPRQFLGRNYEQDAQYRAEFQRWVNQLWEHKDALLEQLQRQFPAGRRA